MRFRASPVVRPRSDQSPLQAVDEGPRGSSGPSESTMSAERDLMEREPNTLLPGRGGPVYHDHPPRLGPMLLWRTSCWLYRRGSFRLAKILKGVSFLAFRAILPPEAELGRDVRMEHYGLNVMIHPNTVIGDRCRIYQGVTVASSANIGSDDRVLIGSDVLIGAGATILNRYGRTLRIGDGCRIGVKALVVQDLPPGSVVRAPVGEVISPEAER